MQVFRGPGTSAPSVVIPAAVGAAVGAAQGSDGAAYELRFDSMFIEGRGLAFPCDAQGRVDIDRLSERARANYLYARAVVGREFRHPQVRPDVRPPSARPAPDSRH